MQKAETQHNQMQNQPAVRQGKGEALESPQGERIAQLEAMAESSPQVGKQAQLAAMANNSSRMRAQRKDISVIRNSPNLTAQRQQLDSFTGETAQSAEAPAKPGASIQLSGREGDEWGPGPGQGESAPPTPRPVQGGQMPPQFPVAESLIQNGYSPQAGEERDETAQLVEAGELSQLKVTQCADAPVKPNNTGLPDNLKNGIESLSGVSMDSVRVHYNSSQPAQLNALAYAQGTDIHVAPGQEQHLPHEAWHVVQQAQGRVRPTMQMKGGVPVNDDAGLEREADVMGGKVMQGGASTLQMVKGTPVKVRNLVGTSRRKCRCTHTHNKTWMNHWCGQTGKAKPKTCLAFGCRKPAKVGAHVWRKGGDKRRVYIVPFCQYHNKRRSNVSIKLKSGAVIASGAMSSCQ